MQGTPRLPPITRLPRIPSHGNASVNKSRGCRTPTPCRTPTSSSRQSNTSFDIHLNCRHNVQRIVADIYTTVQVINVDSDAGRPATPTELAIRTSFRCLGSQLHVSIPDSAYWPPALRSLQAPVKTNLDSSQIQHVGRNAGARLQNVRFVDDDFLPNTASSIVAVSSTPETD